MADYTCSLGLVGAKEVRTEWEPTKPREFQVDDRISFTSAVGDWRVEFNDSPFQPAPEPSTLSAAVNQARLGQVVRDGEFQFQCTLVVDGQTLGWSGPAAGDDIRVRKVK